MYSEYRNRDNLIFRGLGLNYSTDETKNTDREKRKTVKTIAALIPAILLSSLCFASEWELFGVSSDGSCYYYHKNTIRRDEGIIKVWEKVVYSEKAKLEQIKANSKIDGIENLSAEIRLLRYNCSSGTVNIKSITMYDSDGGVILNDSSDKANLSHITPDSISEELYKELCAKTEG